MFFLQVGEPVQFTVEIQTGQIATFVVNENRFTVCDWRRVTAAGFAMLTVAG